MQRKKDVTAGSFRPVCSDFYDVIACVKWAWRIADKSQGATFVAAAWGLPASLLSGGGKIRSRHQKDF